MSVLGRAGETGAGRAEESPAAGRQAYATYLKPRLARMLAAFGLDLSFHRAEGDRLFTLDGGEEREVLDFIGGFGASLLGHNHPELIEVARRALDGRRPFNAQASIRGPAGLLARRLSERLQRITGRDYRATLASTGAEAVEAAIKHAELEMSLRNDRLLESLEERLRMLRLRLRDGRSFLPEGFLAAAAERLGVGRIATLEALLEHLRREAAEALGQEPRFLAVCGSFHGKSTGSLKLTYSRLYRHPWRRIGISTVFIPADDGEAVEREMERARVAFHTVAFEPDGRVELREQSLVNVSACFVEPIQGEGGIHELGPRLLEALRRAADEHGFPLVIDEIQSGMGRTGAFLALEAAGVRGDYYLLSKSLGGGLAKVSALLVDAARYRPDFGVLHTSTFAEDDYASLIALRVLEILERDNDALIRRCRETGAALLGRLRQLRARHPRQLREVRGRGLMIGVELEPQIMSPSPLLRVLSEQNLLSYLAAGYLLRVHGIRVAPTLSERATLRIEPSAYVGREECDRLLAALEDLLVRLEASDTRQLVSYLVAGRRSGPPPPAPAVERRPPPPRPVPSAAGEVPRVAFLAHFSEPADLHAWEPRLAGFDDADCERFLDRTRGLLQPFVLDEAEVRSLSGERARVTVIGVPFTPEQAMESMRQGADWSLDLVRQGVELARQLGSSVVGLGGHTSIVTDNCRRIVEDELTLTSGNSLTVAAAWEASRQAAVGLGLDLGACRLGIAGGAGNVGATLAELAAEEVGGIVLIGRPGAGRFLRPVAERLYRAALERLRQQPAAAEARGLAAALAASAGDLLPSLAADEAAGEILYRRLAAALGERAPVRIAHSMEALRDCQLVVSATNSARPVIGAEHVGDGPVVICDVAVPQDVDSAVQRERPRALVIRGGMVRAPLGQQVEMPAMRLDGGQLWGCLAETILLGFTRQQGHFSYGELTAANVRRIRALAAEHGFEIELKQD